MEIRALTIKNLLVIEIRAPNHQKPTGNWDSLLTIKNLLVMEIRS